MAKQKADKPRLSEAQIRAMVADGKTFPQIAAETGVPLRELRIACSVLGISSPYRPATKIDVTAALDAISNGKTLAEHGASISSPACSVFAALKRAGLPTSSRHILRKGEK